MSADTFSVQDLERAVNDLSMMRFFPGEARESVMTLLRTMCPNKTALRWLVNEAVNHVKDWPGAAELRGLLCTRYTAADGIDQWCSIPGYRAEDYEAKHYEQHKQLMSGGYQQESNDVLKQIGAGIKLKRLENAK